MSACFLLLALAASAVAAFVFGANVSWGKLRVPTGKRCELPSAQEALENPTVLFIAISSVGCVAGAAFTPWVIPPAIVVSALISRRTPERAARRRREAKREGCERHLDMMCDIVAMGVDAGLSFDSALELYCDRFDNELSREMKLALQQWSHGLAGRREVLESLASDVGSPLLKRFSDTVIHAVAQGAPLAGMLRKYAVELRRRRRVSIERKVERAPIKMLVPTGVCILPAMLLLVMGPMLLQFLKT